VLRETVHANTRIDVEAVLSQLRAKCADAGLDSADTDLLLNETQQVLSSLIEQGKRIAAFGSQMEVTRELTGNGYSIRLLFREGVRRTFIQRLIDMVRGT
jgi:hypothetical protein